MSLIRINDLAKEVGTTSTFILSALLELGITEKKSHASPLRKDEADKVREHLKGELTGSSGKKERVEMNLPGPDSTTEVQSLRLDLKTRISLMAAIIFGAELTTVGKAVEAAVEIENAVDARVRRMKRENPIARKQRSRV